MLKECSSEDWFHRNYTCNCDTLYCQTDAACLCTVCDEPIHAANPDILGSIHQRVPIAPTPPIFYGFSATDFNELMIQDGDQEMSAAETGSWLLLDLDSDKNRDNESGEYTNLMEHNTCSENSFNQNQPYNFHHGINGNDSVVPVQNVEANDQQQEQKHQEHSKDALNCTTSNIPNIPAFFLDNGIVPEATVTNIQHPHGRPQKERIEAMMLLQITRMNREAKVLRYREKKKARKFEKKIRYASRKASAEIRPRVRGRFAKTADADTEQY